MVLGHPRRFKRPSGGHDRMAACLFQHAADILGLPHISVPNNRHSRNFRCPSNEVPACRPLVHLGPCSPMYGDELNAFVIKQADTVIKSACVIIAYANLGSEPALEAFPDGLDERSKGLQ